MIELLYIMAIMNQSTDYNAFLWADYWVENNIKYRYFKHPQKLDKILKTGVGDCTDKAILKCHLLKQRGINCRLVAGRVNHIKHDFIQANINGTWISSEPTKILRYTIW
jgi:transglutaminase-like putative cysteine protease